MTRRESREAAMCLLYEYSYNTHKTPGEIVNAAVENREEKLSGFTRELFTAPVPGCRRSTPSSPRQRTTGGWDALRACRWPCCGWRSTNC